MLRLVGDTRWLERRGESLADWMSGSLREIPSGEHLEYKAKVHFSSPESKRIHKKVNITVTFHPNNLSFSETNGCNVSLVIATLWTEGTVVGGGLRPVHTPCLCTVFTHLKDIVRFKDVWKSHSIICLAFDHKRVCFPQVRAIGESLTGPGNDVRNAADRLISRASRWRLAQC